jgi:hypothetical protein
MNQTRTQRIHRGFHRIGAVLAGMILALGLIVVGVAAVEEAERTSTTRFDISTAKPVTIDVRLPNGAIVKNVPQGTTRQQLMEALDAQGYDLNVLRPLGSVNVLDYETFRFDWAQKSGEGPQRKDDLATSAMPSTNKPKWADDPIVEQPSGAGLGYLAAVIAHIPAWLLAGFAAAAAAIYVMCRGVGWIIAGFAGD